MAYKGAVIFVEAPALELIRERYLDDDQYRLLQLALMTNPESADLIYYWITHRGHLLPLTVFRKSEVSDLTPNEVRVLRAVVEDLEE